MDWNPRRAAADMMRLLGPFPVRGPRQEPAPFRWWCSVQESSMVVGVDLVCIADVAHSLACFGERYTRRVFTADEIEYCSRDPNLSGERYAARFAAKEATTKLLRLESDAMLWRSIEVRRDPGGWCDIVLHDEVGAMARAAGIDGMALSMSHERGYAIATVIAHRADLRPD